MSTKVKSHIFSSLITLVIAAIGFYFTLPAISIHNPALLFDIVILSVIYSITFRIFDRAVYKNAVLIEDTKPSIRKIFSEFKITGFVLLGVIVIWLIGGLTSAVFFNAKKYQQILDVKTGDFLQDVDSISYDQIPRLDSASAIKLGDKKLGELSDLVSQFSVVERYYTQINYNNVPVRVTPLEYVDIFKWFNNVSKGVPGYVKINMSTQDVELVRFSDLNMDNMKYSTSEHFGRNLYRHLRFNYPTYIFEEPNFEIDDKGVPYWVCARKVFTIGLYGGQDIGGVVLVNAITGECTYYEIKDVPNWVDRVYNANLIIEQFDYHGTLRHGFFNSVFGQKDCQVTTDGYNYIAMNDDVYMYTGVTSVSSDQSNIGFILTNQRTKETKFYEIAGAEENAAMRSAEGEVQNLRYKSTFPLLLNVGNEPTYFMALKDGAELVKKYAMVNVKQYQIVATGDTLKECETNYIKLIRDSGIKPEGNDIYKEYSGAITDIRSAVIEGNSHYYFKLEGSDKVFKVNVAENNEIVIYNVGDVLTVKYIDSESELIETSDISKTQSIVE